MRRVVHRRVDKERMTVHGSQFLLYAARVAAEPPLHADWLQRSIAPPHNSSNETTKDIRKVVKERQQIKDILTKYG